MAERGSISREFKTSPKLALVVNGCKDSKIKAVPAIYHRDEASIVIAQVSQGNPGKILKYLEVGRNKWSRNQQAVKPVEETAMPWKGITGILDFDTAF
jgi:hypothetical protein